MNKDFYKQTFSGICPSDESIERIFAMTEKKTKRIRFKAILVAAAIVALFACATLTANAATDGALFSGMRMILNGEDVNIADYIKNYKSYKDGDTEAKVYEFDVPDGKGEASIILNEDINGINNSTTDTN